MLDRTYFPGASKYWHNGKIYDWDTRQVHVMAHVLHYGSSVFEGIRAYATDRGPAIFRLEEHIERLFSSAEVMNMKIPYERAQIIEACQMVVRENRVASAYVRPNLFFGYGNLGLTPKACPVELTIGCWEWGAYLGERGLTEGVHVLLLPWKRIHPSQINPSVKLGGLYAQSNIVATHARKHGFDEGLFLNLEGRVAEGPGENILIIKDGVLFTNDKYESILEGLTRTTVLKLAEDMGIKTRIEPITLEMFLSADEAFFTGTAAEVTPITRVTDGRDMDAPADAWVEHRIGTGKPGQTTLKLAQRYSDAVRGRRPEYEEWLTFAYPNAESANQALNGHRSTPRGERLTRF